MRRRLRLPGAGQHVHVGLFLDRLPDVSLPLGGSFRFQGVKTPGIAGRARFRAGFCLATCWW